MIDTLPNLPSEILEVALRDLEIVEKKENVSINMDTYFSNMNNHCYVCHAGAVMMNTLGINSIVVANNITSKSLRAKLRFINSVREGYLNSGLQLLYAADVIDKFPVINDIKLDYHVKSYAKGYEIFYKNYIRLVINKFKENGL